MVNYLAKTIKVVWRQSGNRYVKCGIGDDGASSKSSRRPKKLLVLLGHYRFPEEHDTLPKQEAILASNRQRQMSSSDAPMKRSDAARRGRRQTKTLLLILAIGFLVFGAVAGTLYYALRPITLR